jgi:hypothetical protein
MPLRKLILVLCCVISGTQSHAQAVKLEGLDLPKLNPTLPHSALFLI